MDSREITRDVVRKRQTLRLLLLVITVVFDLIPLVLFTFKSFHLGLYSRSRRR